MKKRTKITLWSILFVIVFTVSALIRVNLLGSAPMRLMQVKWDDTVGTIYNDLNYENDYGHKYDLYVPANLDIGNAQQLEPSDWDILKKVNKLDTDAEFLSMMTGVNITEEIIKSGEYEKYVDMISPARLVNENSVPTLLGYGLKDHLVPRELKYKLVSALEDNGVEYDYFEFPNCNHGMYRDLDMLKQFLELSLEYCERYF